MPHVTLGLENTMPDLILGWVFPSGFVRALERRAVFLPGIPLCFWRTVVIITDELHFRDRAELSARTQRL